MKKLFKNKKTLIICCGSFFVVVGVCIGILCIHKHNYIPEIVDPTCTTNGYTIYTCECGDSYNDNYIIAKGHVEYWITDVEPTCTEKGSKHSECSVCGEVLKTEEIASKGHVEGSWITDVEPTCTAKGSKYSECSVCSEVLKTEEIASKGHFEGFWITDVEPTCTEKGSMHKECSVCSEALITEEIASKGHVEGSWITDVEPTCTEKGSKHLECSVCSEALKTEEIASKGHVEGSWITDVEPTCTAKGSKHLECSVCNITLETTAIPEKEHTSVNNKCSVCHEILVEYFTIGEKYVDECGLELTVNSFTVTEEVGYYLYKINYTLKNVRPDSKVGEGTFDLLMENGKIEWQYGFFSYMYYGDQKTRSYEWKVLKTDSLPLMLRYESDTGTQYFYFEAPTLE